MFLYHTPRGSSLKSLPTKICSHALLRLNSLNFSHCILMVLMSLAKIQCSLLTSIVNVPICRFFKYFEALFRSSASGLLEGKAMSGLSSDYPCTSLAALVVVCPGWTQMCWTKHTCTACSPMTFLFYAKSNFQPPLFSVIHSHSQT